VGQQLGQAGHNTGIKFKAYTSKSGAGRGSWAYFRRSSSLTVHGRSHEICIPLVYCGDKTANFLKLKFYCIPKCEMIFESFRSLFWSRNEGGVMKEGGGIKEWE